MICFSNVDGQKGALYEVELETSNRCKPLERCGPSAAAEAIAA
jgi:hypothetical protein